MLEELEDLGIRNGWDDKGDDKWKVEKILTCERLKHMPLTKRIGREYYLVECEKCNYMYTYDCSD